MNFLYKKMNFVYKKIGILVHNGLSYIYAIHVKMMGYFHTFPIRGSTFLFLI